MPTAFFLSASTVLPASANLYRSRPMSASRSPILVIVIGRSGTGRPFSASYSKYEPTHGSFSAAGSAPLLGSSGRLRNATAASTTTHCFMRHLPYRADEFGPSETTRQASVDYTPAREALV